MSATAVMTAPSTFEWKRWPATEVFVDEVVAKALDGNTFAAELANRLPRETGTSFQVWVDHVLLRGGARLAQRLGSLGYERQATTYSLGVPVFAHPGGIFPRIALAERRQRPRGTPWPALREVAIKVESVAAFSRAHDLGMEIAGLSHGAVSHRPRRRAIRRLWPWWSGAATWASSRFRGTWPARDG